MVNGGCWIAQIGTALQNLWMDVALILKYSSVFNLSIKNGYKQKKHHNKMLSAFNEGLICKRLVDCFNIAVATHFSNASFVHFLINKIAMPYKLSNKKSHHIGASWFLTKYFECYFLLKRTRLQLAIRVKLIKILGFLIERKSFFSKVFSSPLCNLYYACNWQSHEPFGA